MSSAEKERADEALERSRGLAHQVVEGFPSVGVLDVAVLLDVHGDDAHAPMVEQAVRRAVHHDRKRGKPRHRVVEEVLPAKVLLRRRRNGRQEASARGRSTVAIQFPPRGGPVQVVVGARLHRSDHVPDLVAHGEHHDQDRLRVGVVLQRDADLPSRISGIITSSSTRSGRSRVAISTASRPPPAGRTAKFALRRTLGHEGSDASLLVVGDGDGSQGRGVRTRSRREPPRSQREGHSAPSRRKGAPAPPAPRSQEEAHPGERASRRADQIARGAAGPPSPARRRRGTRFSRADRVLVDLESVRAVFEDVVDSPAEARELAGLARE